MNEIVQSGAGVLVLRDCGHTDEELSSIVARKQQEIRYIGFGMWGYGGNTCNPSVVQPFGRAFAEQGKRIYLCIEELATSFFAVTIASHYSADGRTWQEIPEPIDCRASRHAFVIDSLRKEPFTLPLCRTRVAAGPSSGKPGIEYIRGRVDKACLEVVDGCGEESDNVMRIKYVATLCEPYAVFLRGRK